MASNAPGIQTEIAKQVRDGSLYTCHS